MNSYRVVPCFAESVPGRKVLVQTPPSQAVKVEAIPTNANQGFVLLAGLLARYQNGEVMCVTPRSRWIMVMRRAGCVLVAPLLSACSPSDEASPRPIPTSPTVPTQPGPPAAHGRYQMSGRVLDENGTPVPGVTIAVDYPSSGGASTPRSHCPISPRFCWLNTKTNDRGEYSVEFDPRSDGQIGFGFVYTSGTDGYQGDIQWVPTTDSPAVRDLRIRPMRPIRAGESLTVSVDATNSLCTDLDILFEWQTRCAMIAVESGAGILHVEGRSVSGGPAPSVFWASAGFWAWPVPGELGRRVRAGTYYIFVGIPEGAPAQEFNVITTLR